MSNMLKSTERSIPEHPASFASANILSSQYPERERVEMSIMFSEE